MTPLMAVPLELEGQLDEGKEWEVEVSAIVILLLLLPSLLSLLLPLLHCCCPEKRDMKS